MVSGWAGGQEGGRQEKVGRPVSQKPKKGVGSRYLVGTLVRGVSVQRYGMTLI